MGLCEDILSKMPPQYDVEAVQAAYPTTYEESMNTVLTQECIRYNTLLGVMDRSLKESVKALKGLVVMSPELEGVAFAMYDNQVRGGMRETVKVTLGGRFWAKRAQRAAAYWTGRA